MYDWPEVAGDTEAFWAGIARHAGLSLPLSRFDDYTASWRRPDLIFSQTCGYPLTHHFKDKLTLVATPHYDAPGCDGPRYSSFLFARETKPLNAFNGARAAVNSTDSMSGMLALKAAFQPFAEAGHFFAEAHLSGGHLNSLRMVQEGAADVCAIDAVCVALARRYRPDCLKGLVQIGQSPLVPALPFVTIAGDVAVLRGALAAAFADPALAETRARLLLKGFSILDLKDYEAIPALEAAIERAGGLKLPWVAALPRAAIAPAVRPQSSGAADPI